MEQSENIGDLALALSKAQGMLEGASKSSDNPFYKSKYADLHECIEAAKVALSKNDLAVIQTTDTDETGNIWIYTTLAHKSGQWIRGRLRMKPKKDDDQGTGSSITYGRRYCFAAIVGLAQKDDDGNESVTEPKEKADQKKGKPDQKTTADKKGGQSTDQWQQYLEQWCAWIDKFTAATIDQFTDQWENQGGQKALESMPEQYRAKLLIAKNEMVKHLTEKQGER